MLLVLAANLAWIPAVWGFGTLIPYRGHAAQRPAVSGFLGLGVLAAVGTSLNVFAPISPYVSLAALLVGTILFAFRWRRVLGGVSTSHLALMGGVLLVVVAVTPAPSIYDIGLYYLQTVKWIKESSQPLGLATLYDRLGLNSTWFSIAALVECPWLVGQSAFVVNHLALFFAAWTCWAGVRRLLDGDRSYSSVLWASTGLLAIGGLESLSSQSADHPAAYLVFLALALWARALESREEFGPDAFAAVLLSVFAFTVKLSTAPLLAGAPILLWLRRSSLHAGQALRALGYTAALLVPWMTKGIMASGCPLCPSSLGCQQWLPWATPAGAVTAIRDWTRSWARQPVLEPHVVLASWAWLGPWAERQLSSPIVQFLLRLLAADVVAVALFVRRLCTAALATFAVSIAGVAFWFASAPDPRFAWGFLFSVALIPMAYAASEALRVPRRGFALAIAGGVLAFLMGRASLAIVAIPPFSVGSLTRVPTIPSGQVIARQTNSGLVLHVPVSGDQCWSAPLPCIPIFDPRLSHRNGMYLVPPPATPDR